ncbi:TPA: transporter [Legionella pneumophila subsp. pneumophila]|uniref:Transporter n=3 Tax=Legionella pneumophila TaxID=446 RepID=A0A4T1EHI6_LEGPN|nr:transporter [Legionella pneumophila]HAT8876437.1 transporter [Legionella pneumophila subsp. pneumophila]RYX11201.1 transporter [Legionella pneumophila]TIE30877.1 transporter [Legionella pneumophila]TIE52241.1 transporter [Legionella pneumophila]
MDRKMITKQNGIYTLTLSLLLFSLQIKAATDYQTYETVCGEPTDMLSFLERGGIATNPCVVPPRSVLISSGYQYQQLIGEGVQHNFPAAAIQLGLPGYFEVDLLLPNYINQTVDPRIGFSQTQLIVNHVLWFNNKWVITASGTFVFPSGSASFGSPNPGGGVIGILSYNFNSQLNLTGNLGITSQSEPSYDGGQSYTSVNPDLILSWTKNKISLFAEIYGQSKTAPDEGSGFSTDAGVLYQVKKNIAIDFEVDQRITGLLNGVERYYGGGITIQFN